MDQRSFVKNAADEGQVKDAERKEKSGRALELDDFRFVLSSPQGRRVIWRYLSLCGVFESSFTGNNTTFFKEGERNVGLKLMADLNQASPETYLIMLKESKKENLNG